ncbi:hypothetical protein ACH4D5_24090 [Streptomyces sp. NPDC018029]|uniref:hypothetical protein n=1 Tax=Streptomyces sp. NPDC018029 TaxID=3365032 RepID=UPI00379808D1
MCTTGWAAGGPYDRIFVSFAVRRVPQALVEQLAPGGRALMTLATSSPSWPDLAVIERRRDGSVEAQLRAVEFGHRAGAGFDRLFLSAAFRAEITTGDGWTQRSRLAPPADTARGMWLALNHLYPGLVETTARFVAQRYTPPRRSYTRTGPTRADRQVRAFGGALHTSWMSAPRASWHNTTHDGRAPSTSSISTISSTSARTPPASPPVASCA